MMPSIYATAGVIAAALSLLIILGILGHVLLGHIRAPKTTPATFSPQKSNNSTIKIILNKGYGGFSASPKAYKLYAEKLGKELFYYIGGYDRLRNEFVYTQVSFGELLKSKKIFFLFYSFKDLGEQFIATDSLSDNEKYAPLVLSEENREDPILISVVEELGDEASGDLGSLAVVEIPAVLAHGNYIIDSEGGFETLHAKVDIY